MSPWRIFFVFWNILVIAASVNAFIDFNENQKDIAEAFKSVIMEDKARLKMDLHITISYDPENPKNHEFLEDLAHMFLDGSNTRAITINYQIPIAVRFHRHYRILLVDNIASMRHAFKNLLEHGTRNLSFTLIYFSAVKNLSDPQITEAFELCWQSYVLNVGVIVPIQNYQKYEIVLLTYFPYTPTSCELIKPTILSWYNKTERLWNPRNCFPEKVHNFHGCPLLCATYEDMPYLQMEYNANGEIIDFSGIEGKLIKFTAENLNYTPTWYILNDDEILDTYNETGLIFKKLFDKDIWYVVGAFHNKPDFLESAPFSQTNYYFVSNVYLILNHGEQARYLYKILIRPLQMQVWLIIGLLFVIGFAVIFASGYVHRDGQTFISGYGNRTPYYNMFVTFVGGLSTLPLPRWNFARYLLTLWLISTFVLRGAYQSGLYEILRDQPTEELPQTLADVVRRNYIIEMIPENVRFLPNLPEIKHVRSLKSNELQAFPGLATATERKAILTPYEYFGHFRMKNQSISRHLHLLNERLFALPLSMYVRRNSFLTEMLNDQISISKNYGFFAEWLRNYIIDRLERELGNGRASSLVAESQSHSENSAERQINVLSLRELEAIFHLLGFLFMLACGVLVVELLHNKLKKRI